jgi:hypothetical protein
MKDKDLEFERRRQRAFERFGTAEPRCALCGEADWRCLELHHIADHGSGETTVTLCANCHRKPSDLQKDHPRPGPPADQFLNEVGRFLLGLADLLRLAADKLIEFGRELIERACGAASSGEAA